MSLAIATVTLSDRGKRRRFITGLLMLIAAYFSLGNWPLDSWLSRGLWRMLMCLFMILMALFDALAVIGEEKRKLGLTKSSKNEESLQD